MASPPVGPALRFHLFPVSVHFSDPSLRHTPGPSFLQICSLPGIFCPCCGSKAGVRWPPMLNLALADVSVPPADPQTQLHCGAPSAGRSPCCVGRGLGAPGRAPAAPPCPSADHEGLCARRVCSWKRTRGFHGRPDGVCDARQSAAQSCQGKGVCSERASRNTPNLVSPAAAHLASATETATPLV